MAITEKILKEWGGETLITEFDQQSGAWIIIAIHSTRRGPSAGGTRMKIYDSFDEAVLDALKLSRAMTYKFATVDMKWGGGKTVLFIPSELSGKKRRNLLLRFGALIKGLNGRYYAGPDIGTSSEDMSLLYDVCEPYAFSRTSETGGAGSSAIPTAHGVFAAIKTTCEYLFGTGTLLKKNILIQGAGSVGTVLMQLLRDSGAQVSFSETNQKLVSRYIHEGYTYVNSSIVYQAHCDIFSPCAQGAILNSRTIPQLKCKAVVGAANNQISEEQDAELLHERGILYAPDYVVNLGGAMGITAIEAEGLSIEESFANVRLSISRALRAIFERATINNTTTVVAANDIATANLAKHALSKKHVSDKFYSQKNTL